MSKEPELDLAANRSPLIRNLLIVIGWLSVVLGVIGVFLPIMPTTPFILLAGWCFARSSQRFHSWLLNHRYLGPILKAWQESGAIPRTVRNRVLFLLWFSLCTSSYIIALPWVTLALFTLGISVSIYILKMRTL